MSDVAAWTRLTALVTEDPRVLPEVIAAVTDPAGYLATHREALSDRGITAADEVEGIVGLVDALDAVGEVAYADWKEEADEVRALLARLPRVRAAGIALTGGPDDDPDDDPERVAARANRAVAPAGVRIVQLDEGSDAYALVALPAAVVRDAVAAGAALDDVVRTLD